jgi:hypothetical protein
VCLGGRLSEEASPIHRIVSISLNPWRWARGGLGFERPGCFTGGVGAAHGVCAGFTRRCGAAERGVADGGYGS